MTVELSDMNVPPWSSYSASPSIATLMKPGTRATMAPSFSTKTCLTTASYAVLAAFADDEAGCVLVDYARAVFPRSPAATLADHATTRGDATSRRA